MSQPAQPTAPESGLAAGRPSSSETADRFAEQWSALASLEHRPLAEHADVFAGVHARVQAALAEIDGL